MENTEIQLFISKYKQEYNIYERFCDYLEKQFKELIKETDVYSAEHSLSIAVWGNRSKDVSRSARRFISRM